MRESHREIAEGHFGSLTRFRVMPNPANGELARRHLRQLRCFARATSPTKRGVWRRVCVHRLTIRPAFVRRILPDGIAKPPIVSPKGDSGSRRPSKRPRGCPF